MGFLRRSLIGRRIGIRAPQAAAQVALQIHKCRRSVRYIDRVELFVACDGRVQPKAGLPIRTVNAQ